MIDDQANVRVVLNIPQPFELPRHGPLRFLVNGRKKIFAVVDEANGDDMRLAARVGGG
jgi:hypothetical protein